MFVNIVIKNLKTASQGNLKENLHNELFVAHVVSLKEDGNQKLR